MTVTDPPVKLLRRLIPQLTIGAVRFDLSIMVLLLVAFIGMQLAFERRLTPEPSSRYSARSVLGAFTTRYGRERSLKFALNYRPHPQPPGLV